MKAPAIVFLFIFCSVECRKIVPPVDKSANIAFINSEGGGAGLNKQPAKPNVGPMPVVPAPVKPIQPAATVKPIQPAATVKPVQPQPTLKPQQPVLGPMKPQQTVTPVPVYPTPAARPVSTPGPSSVKQLVTFYDSQGKGSVIRPYSYADAVKKNKN